MICFHCVMNLNGFVHINNTVWCTAPLTVIGQAELMLYREKIPYSRKVWWGKKFGKLTLFKHLATESLAN